MKSCWPMVLDESLSHAIVCFAPTNESLSNLSNYSDSQLIFQAKKTPRMVLQPIYNGIAGKVGSLCSYGHFFVFHPRILVQGIKADVICDQALSPKSAID